jgi:hypothetical protein
MYTIMQSIIRLFLIMSFKDEAIEAIAEVFVKALEVFPFDDVIEKVFDYSKPFSVFGWRCLAVAQAAAAGGFLMSIPGLNLLIGIGTDLSMMFYAMQAHACGVGCIIARKNGLSYHVMESTDYIDVLSIWTGAPEFINDKKARSVLCSTDNISDNLPEDSLMHQNLGNIIAPYLLNKVLKRLGNIMKIKSGSLVPGIGAALNAGVNAKLANEIIDAAKTYYVAKFEGKRI